MTDPDDDFGEFLDGGFGEFLIVAVPILLEAAALVMFIGMIGVWIINREQIWSALS